MDSDKLSAEQLERIKANLAPFELYMRRLIKRMDVLRFPDLDPLRMKVESIADKLEELHQFLTGTAAAKKPPADTYGGAKSKREWKRQTREQR